MKHYKLLTLILWIPITLSLSGKDPVDFPELKGWDLKVSEDMYTPANLWDLINGAAESYLAYDFIDLSLADYKNQSGVTIHAEVYRHSSLNNAFGIYASERSPDYNFIDIGGQAYLDEGILNVFSGLFYVKLYSTDENEAVQGALKTVGEAIIEALDQGNAMPELISLFPGN